MDKVLIKLLKKKFRQIEARQKVINTLLGEFNGMEYHSLNLMMDEDHDTANNILNKIDEILNFLEDRKQFNLSDKKLLGLSKKVAKKLSKV